jgi:hypothetical protein
MHRFTALVRRSTPHARSACVASLAALCLVPPAFTQESFLECTRVEYEFDTDEDGLGLSLATVPDVNGDGVAEVLAGSPGRSAALQPGRVRLLDGRTGVELFRVDGVAGDRLGRSVGPVGDLDGDGIGDVAAGAPGVGVVAVFSGTNGALLLAARGAPGSFGHALAGVGDVDLDGVPDLAIGDVDRLQPLHSVRGRVALVSGADGSELAAWSGPGPDDRFGAELARIDVDLDGRSELAVLSFPAGIAGVSGVGRVVVLDLATGAELRVFTAEPGASFGHVTALEDLSSHPRVRAPGLLITGFDGSARPRAQLFETQSSALLEQITGAIGAAPWYPAALGDVDADGIDDFAVAGGDPDGGGQVRTFSGASGAELRALRLLAASEYVHAIAGPDIDGDLVPELVVSAATASANRVRVVSSAVPAETFGQATAGAGGIPPRIGLQGCPRIAGDLRILTEHVAGGARGTLVIGAHLVAGALRGGILYPSQEFRLFHRADGAPGVPGAGTASLQLAMPSDPALTGLQFYAQALYLDAGAPQGVAFTRALRLTLY